MEFLDNHKLLQRVYQAMQEKKWNILEKKTKRPKSSKMETKIVCPAIICSTLLLVFSLVTIVYATMMIYIPANLEMRANVTGPLKCTTIKMDFNVSQGNCHWSSCIEWCLNKVRLFKIIAFLFLFFLNPFIQDSVVRYMIEKLDLIDGGTK